MNDVRRNNIIIYFLLGLNAVLLIALVSLVSLKMSIKDENKIRNENTKNFIVSLRGYEKSFKSEIDDVYLGKGESVGYINFTIENTDKSCSVIKSILSQNGFSEGKSSDSKHYNIHIKNSQNETIVFNAEKSKFNDNFASRVKSLNLISNENTICEFATILDNDIYLLRSLSQKYTLRADTRSEAQLKRDFEKSLEISSRKLNKASKDWKDLDKLRELAKIKELGQIEKKNALVGTWKGTFREFSRKEVELIFYINASTGNNKPDFDGMIVMGYGAYGSVKFKGNFTSTNSLEIIDENNIKWNINSISAKSLSGNFEGKKNGQYFNGNFEVKKTSSDVPDLSTIKEKRSYESYLVGQWKVNFEGYTNAIVDDMTFSNDGKYIANCKSGKVYKGEWSIVNGELKLYINNTYTRQTFYSYHRIKVLNDKEFHFIRKNDNDETKGYKISSQSSTQNKETSSYYTKQRTSYTQSATRSQNASTQDAILVGKWKTNFDANSEVDYIVFLDTGKYTVKCANSKEYSGEWGISNGNITITIPSIGLKKKYAIFKLNENEFKFFFTNNDIWTGTRVR